MGALYLAATGDRGLERLLVIKTVLPHLADAEYVARFRDEAKVVVKLSHGNLIPVFDAGQVDGELFLAMDFVEGKDLRAVWNRCAKKQVAFPIDVAVFIIKELCRGLGYAHGFGDLELVHRDISPPNILISYSGEVKLTDFGLASSTLKLEKTAPGIIYGKVAYMSPEQARGDTLDGRSDLYAAVIVLWELLTGRQLFPPGKEQPQDLLHRARNPRVMAPSRRAPRVPKELDDIVVKALAARPDDRYRDGEALRDALSGWLAKHAPGTDAARLESFLHDLFAEDIARERKEREALLESIRKKARTLPPTHELRQMIEQSEAHTDRRTEPRPASPGRRAADRGQPAQDRRAQPPSEETEKGVAVVVPKPRSDGRTVVTPATGATAAATAEAPEYEVMDPAETTDMLGAILDGRYRVDELIGEGGMGRVYLAEHVDIGKRVAVKILHPVYSRLPDLVERFRREARAASKIGHPHIVDVTDSGTTGDGSVYFVMEYLQGIELGSVIDHEGALDLARSLKIATQICRALSAAHAAGIIHRDLKPENIFLTLREGTSDFVKVLDFGIAKSTEAEQARAKRLTSPGMAMGTPEYMAPEQAAGRPADERCDVYALGAILYEMLTGVPPYEGDNFMEILTKKATLDPVPPRNLRSEIPEEVDALVVQAMARNPDERPRTMEAFEYELTKNLSGRGAAVAKILGMTTDANLVASLNPGLEPRVLDAGLAGARRGGRAHTGTTPPELRSPSPSSAPAPGQVQARSAGVVSSGAAARAVSASPEMDLGEPDMMSSDDFLADLEENTLSVPPLTRRSSGLGLFGWVLLLCLLATGVGVILFVVAGEQSGRTHDRAATSVAPDGDEAETAVADTDLGAGDDGEAADHAGDGDEPGDDERAAGDGGKHSDDRPRKARGDRDRARPRGNGHGNGHGHTAESVSGIPRTRAEAKLVLEEAKAHVSRLAWDEARAAYARVAQGRYYRAMGLLGLAKVSFENKNNDGAIRHATTALRNGAGDPARVLLGHAYFKKGNYDQALRFYEAVLDNNAGNKEAQKGARAARKALEK